MFNEIIINDFVRGIHLCTSLFGAIFLISIWFHVQKQKKEFAQDWGLLLIALALIVWVAIDAFKIIKGNEAGEPSLQVKLFSTFNNAFLIASLPFFKFGFKNIKENISLFRDKKYWAKFVLITNMVIFLILTIMWDDKKDVNALEYFDFGYSSVTLILIGYAITKAFQGRKYGKPFILVSIFITILLVTTQMALLPEFRTKILDLPKLLMIASQLILISLFLVLAQSWVVEESLNVQDSIIEKLEVNNAILSNTNKSLLTETEQLREKLTEKEQQLLEVKPKNEESNTKFELDISCLTDRQIEVFEQLAKDLSYKEIGKVLHIARDTVISNIRNIENKLGIKGKNTLVEAAKKHLNHK